MNKLILASASPRRSQLLAQIGIPFCVQPSKVEEIITSTVPARVVEELSAQKCADLLPQAAEDTVVLGADTVVAFEGKILGKPRDEAQAFEMLQMLQGQTHQVYTGVTLMKKKDGEILQETFHERTDVTCCPMSEAEIRAYIATGEPMDKAGAYGIQGAFAAYVTGICGDYNNVVGLPIAAVYQQLKRFEKKQKADFTVRPVREEELPEIARIEKQCFPEAEAASYEDFVQRFKTCGGSFFAAETKAGELAGFCNGCCTDREELDDEFYHDASLHDPAGAYQMIFGLDVLPAFQKKGMGEALMRHMIASAKERGKKAVILTCKERMIPFYRRLGYEYVKVSDSVHGGAVWHKMIYRF